MSTLQPVAPDGNLWTVGVPLLPWEPRLRRGNVVRSWRPGWRGVDRTIDGAVDVAMFSPGDLFDDIAVIAIVIGGLVLAAFLFSSIVPFAILALELVLAALFFVVVGLWRTVARRPWPVIVRTPSGATIEYRTVGLRRARRTADHLAALIGAGQDLPPRGSLDPDAA